VAWVSAKAAPHTEFWGVSIGLDSDSQTDDVAEQLFTCKV